MTEPTSGPPRHEIKFVAAGIHHLDLENWVRLHPAGFYSPYPPRQVNNVYFDTPAFFAYAENLVGASARSKVRLRWYGDTFQPESAVLEVKRRRNLLGWKENYPTGPLDLAKESWGELRRRLRRDLPGSARIWLDAHPQAVLINRYHRRYHVSRNGRVRCTLDTRQRVLDQRMSSRPNLRRRANLPDTLVVEFKFAQEDRQLASRILQGIPLRVSRNSKYVIGVQSIAD